MIPTLIASFFGMNVPNLFENTPYAFMLIVSGSLGLSLLGIIILRKRHWF
jgi:magnesium transporter